jgi:hypothetical protein
MENHQHVQHNHEELSGHPMARRMDSATQNTAIAQAKSGAIAWVIINDPNAAGSILKRLPIAKDVNNLLQNSIIRGRPIGALGLSGSAINHLTSIRQDLSRFEIVASSRRSQAAI